MNTSLLTAVLLAAIQGGKYINNIPTMMCTSEASTAKPYRNRISNLLQKIIAFMQVSRFVCNMRVCLWVRRGLSFK